MKFTHFALIATSTAQATKLTTCNAFQDVNGEIHVDTVASDLATFTKYWGIDLKSTWVDQGDESKKTLWTFLNTIHDGVTEVSDFLDAEGGPSLTEVLEGKTTEVLDAVEASKVSI